jgi:hypothetical protein
MTKSKFTFAILEKDTGKLVVQVEPRASQDLVAMFAERIKAKGHSEFIARLAEKGVGWFRGTKHVQQDAAEAVDEIFLEAAKTTLEDIIFELKSRVPPPED